MILKVGDEAQFCFTDNITVDVLGRALETQKTYPDAVIEQEIAINGAMQITSSHKNILHSVDVDGEPVAIQLEIGESFNYDNVLRFSKHSITYGNGESNEISRLFYDNEDRLKVKLLGQTTGGLFLQQVDYYYDNIGRLTAINNAGNYECSTDEEVCELSLEFWLNYQAIIEGECKELTGIYVNDLYYDISGTINILNPPTSSAFQVAIEEALSNAGVTGQVTVVNELVDFGFLFSISIENTTAYHVELVFNACEADFTFQAGNCCTIQNPGAGTGGENYGLVGYQTDNSDLYYQHMTYDGLDMSQIELGSSCIDGYMINNYTYDDMAIIY